MVNYENCVRLLIINALIIWRKREEIFLRRLRWKWRGMGMGIRGRNG